MEFSTIAILLVFAGVFGIVAKLFKQPTLIGYLFAGIALSALGLISDSQLLNEFGQVGITLLLFLLGIEMRYDDVLRIGKTSIIVGFFQIIFTSILGFSLSFLLGFALIPSLYLSIALTFSSTIIIVKILSEKGDLESLYGRLSIGTLLVQDFVAIAILMFLGGISGGSNNFVGFILTIFKALMLFLVVWGLSKKVLPLLFERLLSGSTELVFIVSIAWALGLSALVAGLLGFSPEIGGFLAGLALSGIPEHFQIVSKAKPLRDFFLTIFFLFLGTKFVLGGGGLFSILPVVLIFSLFVLIVHPLIIANILGIMGYKKKTSVMVGLMTTQISEFSLIIISIGENLGQLQREVVSIVLLVGIITMPLSTYFAIGGKKLYKKIKSLFIFFERKQTTEEAYTVSLNLQDHIVIIGCDRTGSELIKFIKSKGYDFVVIDHNPSIFKKLSAEGINIIFGDITDDDILQSANISKSRIIISTTSNLEDNLAVLDYLKQSKSKPLFIASAENKKEGIRLYEDGASYVLIPEVVTGDHIVHLLEVYGGSLQKIFEMGHRHFDRLIFK